MNVEVNGHVFVTDEVKITTSKGVIFVTEDNLEVGTEDQSRSDYNLLNVGSMLAT